MGNILQSKRGRTMYLILDCNNLAYRAFFSTGHLKYKGIPTGMLFGFLNYLTFLFNKFGSDKFIFCFDGENNKRKELYPDYQKAREEKRNKHTKEERKKWMVFFNQLEELRIHLLPEVGFCNIFCADG